MASDDESKLDELALKLLKLIHDVIPWMEVPEEVRRDKWRILAKRVMASSGEDLQEFIHNVVRGLAGESFRIKRRTGSKESEMKFLGKELEDLLNNVRKEQVEKKLLAYIKSRAIPLVIRLSAKLGEREEGE